MSKENICDLQCPKLPNGDIQLNPAMCCKHCSTARKYFLTPENASLWTDEYGFWNDKGCKLDRDKMPIECKEYTCKDRMFYWCYVKFTPLVWKNNQWEELQAVECKLMGYAGDLKTLTTGIGNVLQKHCEEISVPK